MDSNALDPRGDLLYGLIEECVRRENYWRFRYKELEENTHSMMESASKAMQGMKDEIERLNKENKNV